MTTIPQQILPTEGFPDRTATGLRPGLAQNPTSMDQTDPPLEDLAARIRDHCIEVALRAYEEAGVQGLCAEGRWEAAIGALQSIDRETLARAMASSTPLEER
ncbi:MAG: hypothetical protein K2Y35_12655 [Burkholderiales bacterium]|nr:hypothetical protein [Burkholderiales bacterium]